MNKSHLLQAYKAASKEAHTRKFKLAGIEIQVPRLNLWNQAAFESLIRKEDPKFSLATTRNRAAMAMARCSETAMKDLRERGVPDEFANENDARMWKQEFLAHLLSSWEPYADALFGVFTRRHMVEALTMSLKQGYGEAIEDGEDKIIVDRTFVETLFGGETQGLETAFLWCTGLQDVPEEAADKGDVAKTLDQMVDELVGNPKASGSGPAESGTTPSSSPSSARRTRSRSTKSEDSTTNSSDT